MPPSRVRATLGLCSIVALAGCGGELAGKDDESVIDPGSLPQAVADASTARDGGVAPASSTPVRDAAVAASDAGKPVVDASTPPAASGCAAHDYAFCEDFEAAQSGTLPEGWTIAPGWNSGTPSVTDAEHHGGTKALKAAVASNGQPRASHGLSGLGALAGKHWGRVFYKVKTPAPLPNQGAVIHNTIVGLKGSTEARVVDTVVNSEGKHQFLYNLPDDSCCSGSSYDYASYDGSWHCAEWYVDASTQTYRFFFEGTEVKSIGFSNHSPQRSHIEAFSAVLLGWINYQTPSKPYEAWLDDLAIDDQQIGCK